MATTSAKMGLRIWNLLTDLYDHAQLADNWAKLDYHDHSPGKGVQIPTEGIADAAITGPKLASTLDPSGAYTSYRSIENVSGQITTLAASAIYVLATSFLNTFPSTNASANIGVFTVNTADLTVAGRSLQYRLSTLLISSTATAPAANFTFGVYPVTAVAAGVLTLGSVVAGSTVANATPGANTIVSNTGTDFTLTTGTYLVGISTNLTTASGSNIYARAKLQAHNV